MQQHFGDISTRSLLIIPMKIGARVVCVAK